MSSRKSRFKIVANIPVRRKQAAADSQEKHIKPETKNEVEDNYCPISAESEKSGKQLTDSNVSAPAEIRCTGPLLAKPTEPESIKAVPHDRAVSSIPPASEVPLTSDRPAFKRVRPAVCLPLKKQKLRALEKNDTLSDGGAIEQESQPENFSAPATIVEAKPEDFGKENSSPIITQTPIEQDPRPETPTSRILPSSPLKSPARPRFVRPAVVDCSLRRQSVHMSSASESEDDGKRTLHASATPRVRKPSESLVVPKSLVVTPGPAANESDSDVCRLALNTKRKKPKVSQFVRKIAEARRDFHKKFDKKKPDRSALKMFDLIFYNPPTNPLTKTTPEITSDWKTAINNQENTLSAEQEREKEIEEENADDFDDGNDAEEEVKMPVPRVKIGANGEIILDEKSLVIESTEVKKGREALLKSEPVFEDKFRKVSYYKRKSSRGKEWSDFETKLFYKALNSVGTDFAMMQALFPTRNRIELKNKFKREERYNQSLLDRALSHPSSFNIKALKETFERDRKFLDDEIARETEEKQRLLWEKKARRIPASKPEEDSKHLVQALLAKICDDAGQRNVQQRPKRRAIRRVFQDFVDPNDLEGLGDEEEDIVYKLKKPIGRDQVYSPFKPFDEPPPEYDSSDSEAVASSEIVTTRPSETITDTQLLKILGRNLQNLNQTTIRLQVPPEGNDVRVILQDGLPDMEVAQFTVVPSENFSKTESQSHVVESQDSGVVGSYESETENERTSVIKFASSNNEHDYSLPPSLLKSTSIVHTFQPVSTCVSSETIPASEPESCPVYEDGEKMSIKCEKLAATDLYGGYDDEESYPSERAISIQEEVEEILPLRPAEGNEEGEECLLPYDEDVAEDCENEAEGYENNDYEAEGCENENYEADGCEDETYEAEDCEDDGYQASQCNVESRTTDGFQYTVIKGTEADNRMYLSNLQRGSFVFMSARNPERPREQRCTMYMLDEFDTPHGDTELRPIPVVIPPDLMRMIITDIKE